tara:strand:+ start:254 stop:1339 length:1086 start_codon:yes stop_codon:yes gene_type:complete
MKSTKKRFSEGGTSEDKEAGLKASKGEDVGFFERLRMGNIDDPKSEAYKRFGAGRGASERASKVPVEDRTGTPVTSMSDDSSDRLADADGNKGDYGTPPPRISMGNKEGLPSVRKSVDKPASSRTSTAEKYTPKLGSAGKKGPSFDDLEDIEAYKASKKYGSNGSRGPSAEEFKRNEREKLLKFTPEQQEAGAKFFTPVPGSDKVLTAAQRLALPGSKAEARALLENTGNMFSRAGSKANEYVQKLLGKDQGKVKGSSGEVPRLTGPNKQLTGPERQKQIEFDRASDATSLSRRAAEGMSDAEAKAFRSKQNPRTSEEDWTGGAIGYRKGGMTKKYANGGSVSASRGDGIAQRGKTRGKMC